MLGGCGWHWYLKGLNYLIPIVLNYAFTGYNVSCEQFRLICSIMWWSPPSCPWCFEWVPANKRKLKNVSDAVRIANRIENCIVAVKTSQSGSITGITGYNVSCEPFRLICSILWWSPPSFPWCLGLNECQGRKGSLKMCPTQSNLQIGLKIALSQWKLHNRAA